MSKTIYRSLLFLAFSISISCVSQPKEEQDRNVAANQTLKMAACPQLIARAQDSTDLLNHLAALYAQRKCGFNFDSKNLSDKEMKIFSARFDLDNTYNTKFKIPRPPELALNKENWKKIWTIYKGSNKQAAISALNNVVLNTTDMSEKSRALFFLSKIYKKMNQPAEATRYMEAAANTDSFSYHSLAAHYELGRPLPAMNTLLSSPTRSFPFDPQLSFLNKEDHNLFSALVQNEEFEMLNRTCFAFEKTWAECANIGAYLAEKVQYYNILFFSFAFVNDDYKKDLFIRYSQFLYPQHHLEKITEMSQKTKTPVPLILAIIKQESSFYTYSLSRAPAYGLMQLIPELAKGLASGYGIRGLNKAEDLFNPDINIPLGTYELTNQIKAQKGQLTYVGIAYNAGPGRLKQWLAQPHSSDAFEFIENIPFEETRNYVKIAARNMLFYQRLMEPDKEFYFPKEFIQGHK